MEDEQKDEKTGAREKGPKTATPKPEADPVAQACEDFGLDQKKHLLASRVREDGHVSLVTCGGVKLVWPDDLERAETLTDREKDGIPQDTPHHNMNAKAKAAAAAQAKR